MAYAFLLPCLRYPGCMVPVQVVVTDPRDNHYACPGEIHQHGPNGQAA